MNDNIKAEIKNILAQHAGDSVLNDTIAQKIAKAVENELKVCTGCGHVQGDDWPETKALACCPDSRYLPLREFIYDWRETIAEKAKTIHELRSNQEGSQTGISIEADFQESTWTFRMPKNFHITAGKYDIKKQEQL